MPIGIAVSESRWHDRRVAEQAHLTAVGMAAERQCNAVGHEREYVGLVGEQDDRRLIMDLRQHSRQIVDTMPLLAPVLFARDQRNLIAKACEPERVAFFVILTTLFS